MAKKVDRAVRLKRAEALIIQHPEWGRVRVNKELRKEYGVGLRTIDVQRLKDRTLIGRPKARTGRKSIASLLGEALITPERVTVVGFDEAYMKLRSAGFINSEIREIFSAGNVPELFGTEPFKDMLRSRRRWFKDMVRRGWSIAQIIETLNKFYGPKPSPFEFLRREYQPPLRVDFVKYRDVARKRAVKITKPLYKGRV